MRVTLLFASVLAGLALGILPRSPRRWVRHSLAFASLLPRSGVVARLLQPGRQGRQILPQIPRETAVGGSHGYEYVTAAFGHMHFHARLPRSADLKLDVVRRSLRLDWRGRRIGWLGGGSGRFRSCRTLRGCGSLHGGRCGKWDVIGGGCGRLRCRCRVVRGLVRVFGLRGGLLILGRGRYM